jgi:antitoxin ParD1/3/4
MPSSYVIGDHFEGFIKQQIRQGRYASASEVIRDGLRALEDQEKFRDMRLEWLRSEIQQGINSGVGRSLEEVADELKTRYQQWSAKNTPVDAL